MLKVGYICDPAINEKCRKTSCFMQGMKTTNCRITLNPEYAKRDQRGDPIVGYIRVEENGETRLRYMRGDKDGLD